MLSRRSMLRLAALTPFAAALPASAQVPDADWKKVVDAARKEGKVVVYNGAVGTPVFVFVNSVLGLMAWSAPTACRPGIRVMPAGFQ